MTDSANDPATFPASIPFLELLGVVRNAAGDGRSEIELELEPRHCNSWEMAHGGVLMTLLDVAMAMAGRSTDTDGRGVVTIEMKTSFLAPGRGTRLIARGHCLQTTTTMCFCEADVLTDTGKLVARGSGTFKFIRRMPPQRRLADSDTGADG